jgi:hypothetical protein
LVGRRRVALPSEGDLYLTSLNQYGNSVTDEPLEVVELSVADTSAHGLLYPNSETYTQRDTRKQTADNYGNA